MWETFWEYGVPLLSTAATIFIGIASTAFSRFTGITVEAKHREALHSAIMTGIGYAKSGLTPGGTAQSGPAIVDQVKEYVVKSVPDALEHFGLRKGAMLHDMIASKIEELAERIAPLGRV
jgi:hypothetical protein